MAGLIARYPQCGNCGYKKVAGVSKENIAFLSSPPRLKILAKCVGCGKILSFEVPVREAVTVLVDGRDVGLSAKQINGYEEEIGNLTVKLAKSLAIEFSSVRDYFDYCNARNISNKIIMKQIKDWGFFYGDDYICLAYIQQIYLPRLKASCQCNR